MAAPGMPRASAADQPKYNLPIPPSRTRREIVATTPGTSIPRFLSVPWMTVFTVSSGRATGGTGRVSREVIRRVGARESGMRGSGVGYQRECIGGLLESSH